MAWRLHSQRVAQMVCATPREYETMSAISKKAFLGMLTAMTVAAAAYSGSAQASMATATFSQSNLFPSATAQNWGTLSTSCDGSSCSVSLTPTGATFFGNEFFGFNLADGASDITLSSTLTSAGASLSTGSFNLDGFGKFDNLISLHDGPPSG